MRGRLIAGLVALLAVACASVGLTSWLAVRNSLYGELNAQLQIATNLAYKCQDQATGDGDNDGERHREQNSGMSGSASPADRSRSTSQGSMTPVPGHPNWIYGGSSIDCPGLDTGTLAAWVQRGNWAATLVPETKCQLSAADKKLLSALPPSQPPQPSSQAPTYVRTLHSAGGDFALTAIKDPDGDGSIYVTGLPLRSVYDTLNDVALTEAIIFGAALVTAGVLGTLWVRLSLRPLRRVAATAATVAELPLEAGEVELPAGVPDTDPDTETGQVGAAFNRMLGHVQQALARRAASEARLRRFAADASHELRTPLAAIRGYAELALRRPGGAPEVVTHALRRVLSESTRMSVLVDDLLLLARLDAGRPLDNSPVDVTRLAIDATSDARVARPDHRWVLDLPDDPVLVRGDEDRLHQVLANLLSNAGRHTPEGTTVTVRLTADAPVPDTLPAGTAADGGQSGGNAPRSVMPARAWADSQPVLRGVIPPLPRTVVTVTDDGPGIPPELLPDLFERFTRADTARSHAADTDGNSTGLGLAIVDAVVTAHSGAVLAASRPGLTRFTIALPRLVSPPDDAGPSAPARSSAAAGPGAARAHRFL
jgi:two-component system OmpR family sensor kinase